MMLTIVQHTLSLKWNACVYTHSVVYSMYTQHGMHFKYYTEQY